MPPDRSRNDASEERPLCATCNFCRSRKVKCDGQSPCSNCIKANNNECIYKAREKPGFKKSKNEDMLKRIETLERRMDLFETGQSGVHSGPMPASSTDASTSQFVQQPEWDQTDFSIPQASGSQLPQERTDHIPPPFVPASDQWSPVSDNPPLPQQVLVQSAIEAFFSKLGPYVPFVSREEVQDSLARASILIYAVLTISMRCLPAEQQNSSFYNAARKHIIWEASESASLESQQALALLSFETVGSGRSPKSFGVIDLLTRSTYHLQLLEEEEGLPDIFSQFANTDHKVKQSLLTRCTVPPSTSPQQAEDRRRLFWFIFVLDRFAAASTGRAFDLNDIDVKRFLPCSDADRNLHRPPNTPFFKSYLFDSSNKSGLTSWALLVQIFDLLGRVHSFQRGTVDYTDARELYLWRERSQMLDATCKRWITTVPVHPGSESDPILLTVRAIYFATIIKLNSLRAYPPYQNEHIAPVPEASVDCLQAAEAMADLFSASAEGQTDGTMMPFIAWAAFVGARALFLHAFSTQAAISPKLHVLIEALKKMSTCWPIADRYLELVRRAFVKLDVSRSNDTFQAASLPLAISILLDIRKTAYEAVLQPSFTPDQTMSIVQDWLHEPLFDNFWQDPTWGGLDMNLNV